MTECSNGSYQFYKPFIIVQIMFSIQNITTGVTLENDKYSPGLRGKLGTKSGELFWDTQKEICTTIFSQYKMHKKINLCTQNNTQSESL